MSETDSLVLPTDKKLTTAFKVEPTPEEIERQKEASAQREIELLRKVVDGFRASADHRDKASRTAADDYANRFAAIEKEPRGEERSTHAAALKREIIEADLRDREKQEPGSSWQYQVDTAIDDLAHPGKPGPAPSAQAFYELRGAFLAKQKLQIADMADSVPKTQQAEFTRKAEACCNDIADNLFNLGRQPANSHQLGKVLVRANTLALQQLTALKRDYPADTTPNATMAKDGKIVLTKSAPPIESLVLQGGGGKGVGYPPMLEEMDKAGIIENVQLLVGTSIGALNAACLACGGLADERQILQLGTFKEAFDMHGFAKSYPEVKFPMGAIGISVRGGKLPLPAPAPSCAGEMAKIDELTASAIAGKLDGKSEETITAGLVKKLAILDDATLKRLGLTATDERSLQAEAARLAQKVKNQDFGGSDRTGQMITFKDLALLHQLDPANFKELTITGWEGEGEAGKLVYLNAQEVPDMPVAVAARISMGLPLFAPIRWRGPRPVLRRRSWRERAGGGDAGPRQVL
jgi:hypothetical protein